MPEKRTKNKEFVASKITAFNIKASTHKLARDKEKLTDFDLAMGWRAHQPLTLGARLVQTVAKPSRLTRR
jgi:hypothetical protein